MFLSLFDKKVAIGGGRWSHGEHSESVILGVGQQADREDDNDSYHSEDLDLLLSQYFCHHDQLTQCDELAIVSKSYCSRHL